MTTLRMAVLVALALTAAGCGGAPRGESANGWSYWLDDEDGTAHVEAVRVGTSEVRHRVVTGRFASERGLGHGGGLLAVVRPNHSADELALVSLPEGTTRVVLHEPRRLTGPYVAGDGRTAAVVATGGDGDHEDSELVVMDVNSGRTNRVRLPAPRMAAPSDLIHFALRAISPDGRRAAIERVWCHPGGCGREASGEIAGTDGIVLDVSTGFARTIAPDHLYDASWSSDGSWLAYTAGPFAEPDLYYARGDGRRPRLVVSGGSDGLYFAFTDIEFDWLESRRLLYPRADELYELTPATGHTQPITHVPGTLPEPCRDVESAACSPQILRADGRGERFVIGTYEEVAPTRWFVLAAERDELMPVTLPPASESATLLAVALE
jgi:hypothetical protein